MGRECYGCHIIIFFVAWGILIQILRDIGDVVIDMDGHEVLICEINVVVEIA